MKEKQKDSFQITIDASACTSLIEGAACFGKNDGRDCWRYSSQQFESGKIYGLISEYEQGCMYLSYLLGGKVDFGDLKMSWNGNRIQRKDLECVSWNLEPACEPYRKSIVKKAVNAAIRKHKLDTTFAEIQERFCLTPEREDRRLFQLSGERWRASAALGFAENKRIFYAPYNPSVFYYQMCQSALLKSLRELTDSGALVLLPAGSDSFLKHIADECIYLDFDRHYEIEALRQRYQQYFGRGDWIR